MHPIHNLQLDPICLDLYDFLTEIRSLLAVPRGSRPLEIADGSVFFCSQAADEMRPLDHFFGSPRPLLVVINKPENLQPLIRQWFPVDSQ
jgi:hypothetical protein